MGSDTFGLAQSIRLDRRVGPERSRCLKKLLMLSCFVIRPREETQTLPYVIARPAQTAAVGLRISGLDYLRVYSSLDPFMVYSPHVGIAVSEPVAGALVGVGVEGHIAPVLFHDGPGPDRPVDRVGHDAVHRYFVALGAVEGRLAVHLGRVGGGVIGDVFTLLHPVGG